MGAQGKLRILLWSEWRKLAGSWGLNRSCLGGIKDSPGREISLYANKIAGIGVVNVRDSFTANGS